MSAAVDAVDAVDALDWAALSSELDTLGCALTAPLWSASECGAVADLDDDDARFRATIDMARYRFGEGRYRYFDVPLPDAVAEMRAAFWPHLLPIARDWAERLGRPQPWPDELDEWLGAVSRRGPDAFDAAAVELRTGRLERVAPRPVRRVWCSRSKW